MYFICIDVPTLFVMCLFYIMFAFYLDASLIVKNILVLTISSVLNRDMQPIVVYTHSKKLCMFIDRTHFLYLFVIWTQKMHFA